MKITEHFTLDEFTKSSIAQKRGIDNSIPVHLIPNLTNLSEYLEKIRGILGNNKIIISSGYRCPELNRAVGGSITSAHTKGLAVDFTCPNFGTPRDVVKKLSSSGLWYDQIILEYPETGWIHFGLSVSHEKDRHQNLTAKKKNGKTVYFNGFV